MSLPLVCPNCGWLGIGLGRRDRRIYRLQEGQCLKCTAALVPAPDHKKEPPYASSQDRSAIRASRR